MQGSTPVLRSAFLWKSHRNFQWEIFLLETVELSVHHSLLFPFLTTVSHGSSASVQFCLVQFSLHDLLGSRGDMVDDSAEILFQSFLQEAVVSSSGEGRDSHSLMLFVQYFFSADHGVAHPSGCPEP